MPCFGEDHLTDQVLAELRDQRERGPLDVFLCDNKNDYKRPFSVDDLNLFIIRTPQLRWLRGTNVGTEFAERYANIREFHYDAYIWLNNDVRLSPHFIAGIRGAIDSYGPSLGLLAPSYDDVWPQQHCDYRGPAASYEPSPKEQTALFIDGACMIVPHYIWNEIGPMDAEKFGKFGWGGDLDYALRVRRSGFDVVVTWRSYFNHLGGGTNKLLESNYHGEAGAEMNGGMNDKYGPGWQKELGI